MKKYILLFTITVFGFYANGQQAQCGTDEYVQEIIDQNPELEKIFDQRENELTQLAAKNAGLIHKKSQAAVLTIPVVFHIIYDFPEDNISKDQILDGLRILNEDYNLQNPDAAKVRPIFKSRQANVEVQFALAKIDDKGNCTDGINRMYSPLSVDANPRDQVKTLVQWDPDKYLNIWVVRSIISSSSAPTGIILGYANFPWMPPSTDGIVIRNDALGKTGTATYDGRTLSHEVGHYLGLRHPFENGCNSGDNIADTPPVATPSYGCNLNKNSCNNDSPDFPDMIENFMDYADGACQNTFTTLQKNRMRSTLSSSQERLQLASNANLIATGVINPPPCQPLALFDIENTVLCPGDSVQFIDRTEDGDPDTYAWSFPGGIPHTSTDRNPKIYYPSPGVFDAILTVTNTAGTSTTTKSKSVAVKSQYTYLAQWNENFETSSLSNSEVSVIPGIDSTSFRLTNLTGRNSAKSIYINNFQGKTNGDIDEFISPSIQTLFGQNLSLTFDLAYAKKTLSNSDLLRVYASTDCGATWSSIKILGSIQMVTAPNSSNAPFIPTASQWENFSVPLDQFEDKGPILIKFSLKFGGGNNFYIDNINVTSSNVSLEEVPLSQKLSVFPNPSNGTLNISLSQKPTSDVDLVMYDLYGKQVGHYFIDKHHTDFRVQNLNLAPGIYVLSFTDGKDTFSQKLIIE